MGKQCNYYRAGFLSTARIIYWFCPFTGVSKLMTYVKRCVQTCTSEKFNQRTMVFFFVTAACTQRRNIQCVAREKGLVTACTSLQFQRPARDKLCVGSYQQPSRYQRYAHERHFVFQVHYAGDLSHRPFVNPIQQHFLDKVIKVHQLNEKSLATRTHPERDEHIQHSSVLFP